MKSRFVKWGLVVAVLLILLWWLLRYLGSGNQPAPAGKDLPLSNTQPAIALPLSNVPQGVLGPPTKQEQEEAEETENPPPAPAPVLFPLKNNVSAATKSAAIKTALAQATTLSSEEKNSIQLMLKAQPSFTPSFTNLLAVDPKRAAQAAAHFNNLTPTEKHQIGLAMKAQPALATQMTSLLAVDGQQAVVGATRFNNLSAAPIRTPSPAITLVNTATLSSEEKHQIRVALKTQPALTESLTNLLAVDKNQAAAGATHYNSLSPQEKHQVGLALKTQPLLGPGLTNLLAQDGKRAVLGATHFNSLPAADKRRIDQTLKSEPGLTESLSKLILEPSQNTPSTTTPSTSQTNGKKRHGGLDHEMEWWGYRCGVTAAQTIVIKDYDTWDQFRTGFPMPPGWVPEKDALDVRLRRPPPVLPDIDFDKMMVIGVFLGKVQEGYRIAISTTTVSADGKTMNVNYGKTFPLPNPMEGTALNEPFDIMVIKRFDGDVYFWNKP